jgi:ribosomal protein S18 acetylase RimI-like enzyme
MTTLRGPASLSMNDECGLLVEGFDGPPVLMMSYNPPWYADLFEGAGLSKATDLLAWRMSEATADLERWRRLNDRVKAREGLTVRPLDLRRFERDVKIVCDLYADAWSKNWGFVPMTNEEIAFMGRQLRPIVLPDLCLFVMKDGREVGFTLALPDVNRVLIDLKGSLFPFGWLKVLLRKNKVGFGRILTLGVRREFHGRGYDALLYHEISSAMVSRGFRDGEMSWILETNDAMNNTIRRAGGEPYRRYRMYEAALSDVAAASS